MGVGTKQEGGRTKGTLEIVGYESKTDALNLSAIDITQLYFTFYSTSEDIMCLFNMNLYTQDFLIHFTKS